MGQILPRSARKDSNVLKDTKAKEYPTTLRSQIEGYTRLLIFRKFSTLPVVIWASPFINFQENLQPPSFFTYINGFFSTLPAVIRTYPLIKFEEKFHPTLLLEPPLVLEI
jgi:hypothetical protein